ncbi:hypothetical protein GCM10019071_14970 [Sphingobium fuliginis]|uniref:Mobile element protein n=1 Tax=Sphingobium fuliginis (strain ATCC 27551) TaxID=336203 RepID=A0ABQ1ETD7_SPHSA|nr:hypothetical protein GCM10019071_14970 [Sphingobium fuliginis]
MLHYPPFVSNYDRTRRFFKSLKAEIEARGSWSGGVGWRDSAGVNIYRDKS